ncbi:MAG: hypothetical protein EA378_10500 [Phycisphaerales bacterium]|nr:MAG: hypothetical protein EA378_10500 [Phycisphaerales bacterium]
MGDRLHILNTPGWFAQASSADDGRWAEIARGLRTYFDEQQEIAASGSIVLVVIVFIIANVMIARKLIRVLTSDRDGKASR